MKLVGIGLKYGKHKSDQINQSIVGEIATALGFEPTAEAIEATTALIRTSGGNQAIGQWLAAEGNFAKVTELFVKAPKPDEEDVLGRCPHCGNLFALDVRTLNGEDS